MSNEEDDSKYAPDVSNDLEHIDLKRQGKDVCYADKADERKSIASVSGSTDFESWDLEKLVALIGEGQGESISDAAAALCHAAADIRDIGREIKKHVRNVQWEGDFGDAFREWGEAFGKHTVSLGDFADAVGTHLAVAGGGLSDVKGGMPKLKAEYAGIPRVEDIPMPERVETNEKYVKAKAKEKDRQEAINQANRLASYYRVSHDSMAKEKEPKFEAMPNVGMPTEPPKMIPSGEGSPTVGGPQSVPNSSYGGGVVTPTGTHGGVDSGTESRADALRAVGGTAPPAKTEIDSFTAAPPREPAPAPSHSPSQVATGQGPIAGPSGVPVTPGLTTPTKTGLPTSGRATAAAGGRPAVPQQSAPGGTVAPRHITGGGMGGTGVVRPGTPAVPPAGQGIVGGTPQQGGGTSPRLPGGNVVGNERGLVGRPMAGTGMPGASAPISANDASPSRRLTSTPGGVVGVPRNAPAHGVVGRPFTQGGTGLVRSGEGRAASRAEQVNRDGKRDEPRRPQYLTEDNETWTTGRTGVVPPVVD